jgi:hypothetical protein
MVNIDAILFYADSMLAVCIHDALLCEPLERLLV